MFDGKVWFDAGKAANFDYRDRVHDFKDRFAISAWFYPESENSGAIVTRMSDDGPSRRTIFPKDAAMEFFSRTAKSTSTWSASGRMIHFVSKQKTSCRSSSGITCWLCSTACNLMTRSRSIVDGQKQTLKVNNGRLFRQFSNGGAHLRIGGGRRTGMALQRDDGRSSDLQSLPSAEQIRDPGLSRFAFPNRRDPIRKCEPRRSG